jgi:hypothetical protein
MFGATGFAKPASPLGPSLDRRGTMLADDALSIRHHEKWLATVPPASNYDGGDPPARSGGISGISAPDDRQRDDRRRDVFQPGGTGRQAGASGTR